MQCFPESISWTIWLHHELLVSQTPKEIIRYISSCQWSQAHSSFPAKPESVHQSKTYFLYRTNRFINDVQKALAEYGEMKSDGNEVIDHEQEAQKT